MTPEQNNSLEGIAIIGMACRFPGANNVNELWNNICDGRESITFFSDDELDKSIPAKTRENKSYVKAKGVIEDPEKFDADFFKINPREAEIMDPQQRVFLETAWHALEDAGCDPDRFKGMIGVYGGTGNNSYFINNVLSNPEILQMFGEHQAGIANGPDYMCTRVSYKLDLKGPSINVFTGCSLSLVAVCMGFESLLSYQCDIALAGGVFINSPIKSGYFYQEGGMKSKDGHCRPFDAEANGTVFSDGVGIVVLKRLEDAVADKDHIYAVIKSVAMNNDGSKKVSFTAPSVDAQADVVAIAQANADIDPETISYVECHGTGTPVGDPIEISALTQAFRYGTNKKNFCAIGSVKSNIGHLDAASGVAGLIKTALMLHYKKIPPTLHFQKANPKIDLADSPFYINNTLIEWPDERQPRRAGVTSLGVGGTNAHAILEEFSVSAKNPDEKSKHLLLLSAKTKNALDMMSISLSDYLEKNPDINLDKVAYTLKTGRKRFEHQRAVICENHQQAVSRLKNPDPAKSIVISEKNTDRDVVFMFSGQGAQYPNMGYDLYKNEKYFRKQIDLCAELLIKHLKFDIRDILYPKQISAESSAKLNETYITQPALFIVGYALAQLWLSWGIKPAALVGHSIGEYVAACLAGVFTLEDALAIVTKRGQLMQEQPPGSMLAVSLPENLVTPMLPQSLVIATINSPEQCVVSGETVEIKKFQTHLIEKNINSRILQTSHAFHSKMMDPVLDEFSEYVSNFKLNKPVVPLLSNVSGVWITDDEAISPDYWAKHLRQTVRFADNITQLMEVPNRVFLEVGPGNTLSSFIMQHPAKQPEHRAFSSLRHAKDEKNDHDFILLTLAKSWAAGINVDWIKYYGGQGRQKVPLPQYPFERKRYWLDPGIIGNGLTELGNEFNPDINQDEISEAEYDEKVHFENETELFLAKIWKNQLGVSEINRDDDFFELGGSSFMALRIFSQIETKFNKNIPLATLFKAPTIRELAKIINEDQENGKLKNFVDIKPGGSKKPFYCVHAEGGNVLEYHDLAKHMDAEQPFIGIQSLELDGDINYSVTIEDMALRYFKELKEKQPDGPYLIGGYCTGGQIAYEMASLLEKNGDEVALLAIINTRLPDYLYNYKQSVGIIHKIYYKILERAEVEINNISSLSRREIAIYAYDRIKKVFSAIKYRIEKPLDSLFQKLNWKYKRSLDFSMREISRVNDKAYHDYIPPKYSGTVHLLKASKTPKGVIEDSTLGWKKYASGKIVEREVFGYHKNILRTPNVIQLANQLQKTLDDSCKSEHEYSNPGIRYQE